MTPYEVARVEAEIALACLDVFPERYGHPETKVYLEIGSLHGGSLWHFGRSMPFRSRLVSVEISEDREEEENKLAETAARLRDLHYDVIEIRDDSHAPTTLREVRDLAGTGITVLLIDGDHSPEGIRQDLEEYVPIVRPGGLVLVHDAGVENAGFWSLSPLGQKQRREVHREFIDFVGARPFKIIQEREGVGIFRVGE